jgi:transcriptional regulator with XRE-family HTH domain
MFSERIGSLLKNARRHLDLSREELARRGGVSTRLVAELERGQRPNVSLETALKLLDLVGVSVIMKAPNGVAADIQSESRATAERAARAARRRRTWTGRHVLLHHEDEDPLPTGSKVKRLASVAEVSKQAHVIASARRGQLRRQKKGRAGR